MHRWFAYGLCSGVAVFVVSGGAVGQTVKGAKGPESGASAPLSPSSSPSSLPSSLKELSQKLGSGDPEKIKGALDEARLSGKGAARIAPAIVELLQKGIPYALAVSAIDTLGDIESESSSAVIAWYARHRDADVRRAAVKALVHTKGTPASLALRVALSDADAMVRGTAATGLGALKAKDAVAELFVALDHRVNEAASSIGALCNPVDCDALAARLGKLPFDVVTSGLDPILFRPPSEVSDDAKVKLVGRIRELGTGEANKFLRDVQKRWPTHWSARIKQSIDQGVQATAAAPGAPTGAQ